jgi:hypothetical protein
MGALAVAAQEDREERATLERRVEGLEARAAAQEQGGALSRAAAQEQGTSLAAVAAGGGFSMQVGAGCNEDVHVCRRSTAVWRPYLLGTLLASWGRTAGTARAQEAPTGLASGAFDADLFAPCLHPPTHSHRPACMPSAAHARGRAAYKLLSARLDHVCAKRRCLASDMSEARGAASEEVIRLRVAPEVRTGAAVARGPSASEQQADP